MGYDIFIGNGELEMLEYDDEETPYYRIIGGKKRYFKMRVKSIKQPDAPTFPNDEFTGNGNSRHPGYTSWGHFCEVTGLAHLFFSEQDGLMREHPGYQSLQKQDAATIRAALKKWQEAHPNAVPGFEAFYLPSSGTEPPPHMGYDSILARLIWLDWWVNWALQNCEHAGVYNF